MIVPSRLPEALVMENNHFFYRVGLFRVGWSGPVRANLPGESRSRMSLRIR